MNMNYNKNSPVLKYSNNNVVIGGGVYGENDQNVMDQHMSNNNNSIRIRIKPEYKNNS